MLSLVLFWIEPVGLNAQISASQVIQKLGYPPGSRLLLIHGDDFGVAHSVDMATEEALEKGWITSASMMVPCPWFPEAAKFAREHPELDLGLHLTLTSEWMFYRWGPVSSQPIPSLRTKDGYLPPTEDEAAAQDAPADVARELSAQIEMAREAGVKFTHFDSHMGTLFQTPQLFSLYQEAGHDNHVPTFIVTKNLRHQAKSFSIHSSIPASTRVGELYSLRSADDIASLRLFFAKIEVKKRYRDFSIAMGSQLCPHTNTNVNRRFPPISKSECPLRLERL
jgi:predicted glycoside hydrolase/deacetylase ChbG (UPF0249 family)